MPSVSNELSISAKSEERITRNALIQAIFTFMSRACGMIRDAIMFHVFGASQATDAFLIAFTIPNVLRRFFGEGALGIAFVPVYMETKTKDGQQKARKFFKDTFGILLVSLLLITFLGTYFSEEIVYFFALGFQDNPEKLQLTISMTRFLFPYIAFISIVALFGAYLQCFRKFAPLAAAPILLNIAMISCMFLLPHRLNIPIYSLVIGVLIGGVLQVLLLVSILKKENLWSWPSISFKSPAIKKLLLLIGPSLFGIFVYQLNVIVLRQLASFLGEGQISYYYNADRLTQFATGVFAVSIASASLPEFSNDLAKSKLDFFSSLKFALRLSSFVITPCVLGLMVFAKPIVSVLYFHGSYTQLDVLHTSSTLIAFAPSTLAFGFSRSIIQAFYANSDSKTPVFIGIVTVFINAFLGMFLLQYEVVGLAATLSIASFLQFFMLYALLKMKLGLKNSFGFFKFIFMHINVSLISCGIGLFIAGFGEWNLGLTPKNVTILSFTAMCCGVSYFLISHLLGLKESKTLLSGIIKKGF